jgi:mRNA interferase MazF
LLCGISSQITNFLPNWDEFIDASDPDYIASGLHQPSIVRLSYLYAADPAETAGTIGAIDPARLDLLQTRLARQIKP